ncbi:MAG: hypothetical protein V4819_02270 [Verrucomicrobiota bacterium]
MNVGAREVIWMIRSQNENHAYIRLKNLPPIRSLAAICRAGQLNSFLVIYSRKTLPYLLFQ